MQVAKVNAFFVVGVHGDAVSTTPCSESSKSQEAFSNYALQDPGGRKKDTSVPDSNHASVGSQEEAMVRTKRETAVLDMTLRHVSAKLGNLNSRARQQLNDIAAQIKGMNVDRIQIDAYALFLKEVATPRAEAVKAYLACKGIDQDLIYTKGYGTGLIGRSYPMGRDNAVQIKVYGAPKQEETVAEAATPLTKRSVELLIA